MDLFAQAIQVLRDLLIRAAACKKPDQQGFEELLNPLQASIEAVTRAKEANRKEREWFNHLTVVAEGAVCVGWVTVVSARSFLWIFVTRHFVVGAQAGTIHCGYQGIDHVLLKQDSQRIQGEVRAISHQISQMTDC